MLCKKRWSDGLNQDFDYLNEFEAKFYCFGGDGGGGGGGVAKPKGTTFKGGKISDETKVTVPDAPAPRPRGFASLIDQMNRQRTLDMVNRAAQDSLQKNNRFSLEDQRSIQNIAPRGVPTIPADPTTFQPGLGIGEPTMPTDFQSGRGIGEPTMPTTFEPVSFTTVAPSIPSLPSLASYPDMTSGMSPNVNTYSPPPPQRFTNPLTYNLGTGASVTPQLSLDSVGLQFNQRFKDGGVVTSGIGSLFKS